MNLSKIRISDEIRILAREVHPRYWDDFFDDLIVQNNASIGTLSTEELTALQARVNILNELRQLFQQIRNHKPTS